MKEIAGDLGKNGLMRQFMSIITQAMLIVATEIIAMVMICAASYFCLKKIGLHPNVYCSIPDSCWLSTYALII